MITHQWLNIAQLCPNGGLRKYYNLYRILVKVLPISILRNQFNAQDGIWIVAKKEDIQEIVNNITNVIKEIEDKSAAKEFKKELKRHGHEIKANYKLTILDSICEGFVKEWNKAKKNNLRKLNKIWKESNLRELFKTYIKETPSLNGKKPFHGKIKFSS